MKGFEKIASTELQLIDLDKIIHNSKSRILKKMPRFIINYFKKLIRQEEINNEIIKNRDKYGLDFIRANVEYINISMHLHGIENLPDTGRFLFVCNHPLGGADFYAALIAARKKYPKVKVIANDILMNFKNLQDLFLPVNAFGRSPQHYYDLINKALESPDIQVMTFPAGEVSRMRKGVIKDGTWHRSFIRNAVEFKRDIVPMYIHAKNSKRFYRLGHLRVKLGIKLNLELLLLPDELFRQRNKSIHVVVGKPIPWQQFTEQNEYYELAQEMKEMVYKLKNKLPKEIQVNY